MKEKKGSTPASKPTPKPKANRAITAMDIQEKEFRRSMLIGYKERDVDEFLDVVTDAFSALEAEVERLRFTRGPAPVVGTPDLEDVSRQADEIIRRARDQAATLVAAAREEAERVGAEAVPAAAAPERPATVLSAKDTAAVGAFLANERSFLQSLAGLVQGHAETVKGMVRAAREEAPAGAGARSDRADAPEPSPERSPERSQGRAEKPVARPREITVELPAAERPVRLEEPQPASVVRVDSEPEPQPDRSLRDLFWGED